MMGKVKLTQEQLEALEIYKANSGKGLGWMQYFAVAKEDFNGLYSSLKPLTLDEMARLLYEPDSFEVEEEYKVGDWVVTKESGRIAKVTRIAYGNMIFDHWNNRPEETWNRLDHIRHATSEEIKAEQELRVWAGIGREVGEFRDGDFAFSGVTGYHSKEAAVLKGWYDKGKLNGFYPAESFISFGGESHDN